MGKLEQLYREWQDLQPVREENGCLSMTKLNCDDFCSKVEQVCDVVGYSHKTREENKAKLSSLIVVE